jgi:hypothetical protein
MTKSPDIMALGLRLLRREQRIVWWTFVINLLLALLSSFGFMARIRPTLDTSLHARRLYESFDLGAFVELLDKPSTGLSAQVTGSAGYALVFFVFMVFMTGGVLAAFRADTRLTAAEFFQACGAYFGRLARITLALVIALLPVAIFTGAVQALAGRLSSNAAPAKLGFYVNVTAGLIALALTMTVRLWFDIAQVHAVVEDERRVLRSILCALRLAWSNFAQLFWMYLRISLVSWIAAGASVWIWLRLPHPAIVITFLLGEVLALIWLAARFWRRAAEVAWYEGQRAASQTLPRGMGQPVSAGQPDFAI